MTRAELNVVRGILKDHYRLQGTVSDTEARDEIRSLARKHAKGSLDDKGEHLAARIHVATGRDVVELFKGE